MTFEKIREMLSKQMDIPEESITMDSRLVEDLKADSLDVVELIILQTVPASYGGCGYFGMEEANGAGICEAAKAQ